MKVEIVSSTEMIDKLLNQREDSKKKLSKRDERIQKLEDVQRVMQEQAGRSNETIERQTREIGRLEEYEDRYNAEVAKTEYLQDELVRLKGEAYAERGLRKALEKEPSERECLDLCDVHCPS